MDKVKSLLSSAGFKTLIFLLIMATSIPISIFLIKQQQIIKSKATSELIQFTGTNIKTVNSGGEIRQIATLEDIEIELTIPTSPTPTPSSSATPRPSTSPSPSPTPSASATPRPSATQTPASTPIPTTAPTLTPTPTSSPATSSTCPDECYSDELWVGISKVGSICDNTHPNNVYRCPGSSTATCNGQTWTCNGTYWSRPSSTIPWWLNLKNKILSFVGSPNLVKIAYAACAEGGVYSSCSINCTGVGTVYGGFCYYSTKSTAEQGACDAVCPATTPTATPVATARATSVATPATAGGTCPTRESCRNLGLMYYQTGDGTPHADGTCRTSCTQCGEGTVPNDSWTYCINSSAKSNCQTNRGQVWNDETGQCTGEIRIDPVNCRETRYKLAAQQYCLPGTYLEKIDCTEVIRSGLAIPNDQLSRCLPGTAPSSSSSPRPSGSAGTEASIDSIIPSGVTITHYKISESDTDAGWDAAQQYPATQRKVSYKFVPYVCVTQPCDTHPRALRRVYVQLIGKNSDNSEYKQVFSKDIMLALKPVATSVSCEASATGTGTNIIIKGLHFGTDMGGVSVGNQNATITQDGAWTNLQATANIPTPISSQSQITLTTPDGQQTSPVSCTPGQTALNFNASASCSNVTRPLGEASIEIKEKQSTISATTATTIFKSEKVNFNSGGAPIDLNVKLIEGQEYNLIIQATNLLRRVISFKAGKGTTNIENVDLPIGDIAPATGDCSINTLDRAELIRQWGRSVSGSAKADFDQNEVVNTADLACLISNFNKRCESP